LARIALGVEPQGPSLDQLLLQFLAHLLFLG
jgi:hypothetical protein